jgi:hypothetical protein
MGSDGGTTLDRFVSKLIILGWATLTAFLEFAVQGCDGAVAFAQSRFGLVIWVSLAVSRIRRVATKLGSVSGGGG